MPPDRRSGQPSWIGSAISSRVPRLDHREGGEPLRRLNLDRADAVVQVGGVGVGYHDCTELLIQINHVAIVAMDEGTHKTHPSRPGSPQKLFFELRPIPLPK